MAKHFLKKILSSHFLKYSLIPILVVEVTLIILYFSINKYISTKNIAFMLNKAQNEAQRVLKSESDKISEKLAQISEYATVLQKEHQSIFEKSTSFSLPNGMPTFDVAPNGVFYKTNEVGASLYYSSKTPITQKERNKAVFTEVMDLSLQNIVDVNPLIVASYFNSFDDMNRLYPFIPKVYEQYGEHIHMEDYNFYYLADKKHNPSKSTAWTSAYLDPAGNGWMLSCIVPIYNKEFLEGVTGLDVTIDLFVKQILDAKLPFDASLFMVDNEGMIIAMPEKIEDLLGLKELKEHLYTDVLLKTIEKPEEYNLLKNKSPFATHFKNLMNGNQSNNLLIKDKEYLTYMENVSETNWKMMILIDKNKIFSSIEELENLTNKIGYLAILFLVLFYVIFFYLLLRKINIFSTVITKPIEELSNQTALMTKKDIDFVPVKTDISEISKLSNNFQYMIKELKKQANELNNARITAESANRAKDEFLANVSHELKTPLNSINVLSEIMSKNKSNSLDEINQKNIGIINKCANDLSLLINDILDLSRIDAGKIELDIHRVDIKQICNDIFNSFEQQMHDKALIFTMNIDEDLDTIISDETRIKQILKNLLSNALKFTPEGKKIHLDITDSEDNIKLSVKDEGIGIEKNRLEFIFDRFTQVDASISRKYGGTGLGLTICKQLVTLLGGEIFVYSKLDEGTTFEVLLPKDSSSHGSVKSVESKKKEDIVYEILTPTEKKEHVVFYNQNPLDNMILVIDLKKKYELTQIFKFDELMKYLNEKEYDKVLANEEKISQEELEEINKITQDKVIYTQHL